MIRKSARQPRTMNLARVTRRTAALAFAVSLAVGGFQPTVASAEPMPHVAFTVDTFASYTSNAQAITYDQTRVPAGSNVIVVALPNEDTGDTAVWLAVTGLLPNHQYGAHAHKKSCGLTPEDSGSHYQNMADPVKPSVNPAYANPRNEIWLDFVTDSDGVGVAQTTVPWQFADRHAHSVVIHAEHTMIDSGHAGKAGARLACVDVDF